jgi:hypothetical protein
MQTVNLWRSRRRDQRSAASAAVVVSWSRISAAVFFGLSFSAVS